MSVYAFYDILFVEEAEKWPLKYSNKINKIRTFALIFGFHRNSHYVYRYIL